MWHFFLQGVCNIVVKSRSASRYFFQVEPGDFDKKSHTGSERKNNQIQGFCLEQVEGWRSLMRWSGFTKRGQLGEEEMQVSLCCFRC